MTTAIRTRKPTGRVPWPLVLIEGPEKSGKSYAAAQFTWERIVRHIDANGTLELPRQIGGAA